MSLKWLLLIPTELERKQLQLHSSREICVELCGFGLVVAAANASRLIARYRPQRVMLCGIAGGLSKDVKQGSAYQFSRVGLYGVGVGRGTDHVSAQDIGWKQWEGDNVEIGSELPISSSDQEHLAPRELLVSCCAASANSSEADMVLGMFPKAKAEDMEGFAVASASKLAGLPCHIVRGISNFAGDRNHANWKIAEAMDSASKLTEKIVSEHL